MDDHVELYRKYRPKTFKTVLGQDGAVQSITKMLEENRVPHTWLFAGPSGCGKTTLARILAKKLECGKSDLEEVNAASTKGIDMVRDITSRIKLAPIGGRVRVWIIDEAHQLTSQAEDSFLKILEDPPSHVYFFLCTTSPEKLRTTTKTRCNLVQLSLLDDTTQEKVIQRVAIAEGIELDKAVLAKLIEYAEGMPRRALVLLHSIVGLEKEAQLKTIVTYGHSEAAIELCWKLLDKKPWPEVAELLKQLQDEPENLRRMIINVMSAMMLNQKRVQHCSRIIDLFQYNFYDTGKAGLVQTCYRCVMGK